MSTEKQEARVRRMEANLRHEAAERNAPIDQAWRLPQNLVADAEALNRVLSELHQARERIDYLGRVMLTALDHLDHGELDEAVRRLSEHPTPTSEEER